MEVMDVDQSSQKMSSLKSEGEDRPMTTNDEGFSEDVQVDFESNNDTENIPYNIQSSRGGFRGRGSVSPRFRSPNFNPGAPIRGRGGNTIFFRGGNRNGGAPTRFGNPNFEQNWNQTPFSSQQIELWVETKTEDGKSYYYHAVTRETTWTRPDGPQVKVMTQSEVEAMQAAQKQQTQGASNDNIDENGQLNGDAKGIEANGNAIADAKLQSQTNVPPPVQNVPNLAMTNALPMPQPTQTIPNQFNAPPPFSYGMPPPGYMNYPPNAWQMPWQQQQPPPMLTDAPAKNLITKSGIIDPQIIAKAAEWSEHRAPDGRPYYYHSIRGESVWEKPQAIRDLEAARMTAHSGSNAFPIMMPPMGNSGFAPMHPQMAPPGAVPFDPTGFSIKTDTKEDEAKEKKRKAEAERKKKEEEEKLKQTTAKPQDKSRPVSSTPIAGTPWCVVWTGDGRVFFYNPSSRTSVWERPQDLVGRPDVDKAIAASPDATQTESPTKNDKEKPPNAQEEIIATNGNATTKRIESDSSGENDEIPTKKLRTEDESVAVTPTVPISKSAERKSEKESAIEAEVRAARERALVPLETRVSQFKEMLKEKDVSAFSTWEKELHKIVFDPRYLLLTSRERKQVFEKYVKERAEEERREKRNKMRQKRDEFRNLMESANLHGKSSFSEFAQKYGRDERFKGIEKMRDREGLFNEYILEVRRREKDEKVHKKETIRKEFSALLREHSEIDRHSRWNDIKKRIDHDSRYRAVESSLLREDYFIEYCKILKEERRKQKDKERDRKDRKDRDSKREHRDKDKDKKDGKKDRRDKHSGSQNRDGSKENASKIHDLDKDDLDQEDGEHPPTSEDEAERLLRERERQLRAEQSIKEREKEVQLQLAGHMRDLYKEREHHKRDEAMRAFNALLADLVRNPELTWKEAKKQLRKDHRWEAVEQLERDDRERIFNDHIVQLSNKKRDKFREMLEELPKFNLTVSWKEIKKQIRDDSRYLKFNSSEKCEREFREYIRDKTNDAKIAFKELLQECKLITYKTFEMIKENPGHVKEIEEILKNDKRYLILDHIRHERSQILTAYLEELHKRGPPPPPTASESSRRK